MAQADRSDAVSRAARLPAGALVALAATIGLAGSLAAQVAIVDTTRPFVKGAVEQESAMRGPMGWPTYQEGMAGPLYYRLDPDGYARFGPSERLDADYWEVTCSPDPVDCIGRRGDVTLRVESDGLPSVELENAAPQDRFRLDSAATEALTLDEIASPARAPVLLAASVLTAEESGRSMPVDGLAAVAAYIRWAEGAQADDLRFDAAPPRPIGRASPSVPEKPAASAAAGKAAPDAIAAPAPVAEVASGPPATPAVQKDQAAPSPAIMTPSAASRADDAVPKPEPPKTKLEAMPAAGTATAAAEPVSSPAVAAVAPTATEERAAEDATRAPSRKEPKPSAPPVAPAKADPAGTAPKKGAEHKPAAPGPAPAPAIAAASATPLPAGAKVNPAAAVGLVPEGHPKPAPAGCACSAATPVKPAAPATPAKPAPLATPAGTLRGLPGLLLVTDALAEPEHLKGRLRDQVRKLAEERLKAAGLRLLTAEEVEKVPGKPRLELDFTPGDLVRGCLFRTSLSLRQELVLARDRSLRILGDTWSDGGVSRDEAVCRGAELATFAYYIDRFVEDWRKANDPASKPNEEKEKPDAREKKPDAAAPAAGTAKEIPPPTPPTPKADTSETGAAPAAETMKAAVPVPSPKPAALTVAPGGSKPRSPAAAPVDPASTPSSAGPRTGPISAPDFAHPIQRALQEIGHFEQDHDMPVLGVARQEVLARLFARRPDGPR
jgi:hypothetical protein